MRRETVILQHDPEWNLMFIQGMANRMAVGRHRYGSIYSEEHKTRDMIKGMRDRIAFYEQTGNTEVLQDVANFAMIEFTVPHHPNAYFKALEHEETPPVVGKDGKPWILEDE